MGCAVVEVERRGGGGEMEGGETAACVCAHIAVTKKEPLVGRADGRGCWSNAIINVCAHPVLKTVPLT